MDISFSAYTKETTRAIELILSSSFCNRTKARKVETHGDDEEAQVEYSDILSLFLNTPPKDKVDYFSIWWGFEEFITGKWKKWIGFCFKDRANQLGVMSSLVWLKKLSFTVGAFAPLHPWLNDYDYASPTFADGLFAHGWACAFKGEGHKRLVSRRWLEWGPWRLIRDEAHDISFVQFHDLEADAATALEQAKPGHQRMGIHKLGGFLQTGYCYWRPPKGIYIESERRLDIVITPGRTVPQLEMSDAAAARNLGHFAQPVDSICYIFYDEEQAREHLHEMWLRELQVYWINMEGEKVRLDDSYDPGQPVKPDWVLELERREA